MHPQGIFLLNPLVLASNSKSLRVSFQAGGKSGMDDFF